MSDDDDAKRRSELRKLVRKANDSREIGYIDVGDGLRRWARTPGLPSRWRRRAIESADETDNPEQTQSEDTRRRRRPGDPADSVW